MHGDLAMCSQLVAQLQRLFSERYPEGVSVGVCPPAVYLQHVHMLLKNASIALGAQNVNENPLGAFTGEVSASMLKDIGCQYVLVGHSERRQLYGESNELVAKKFEVAQSQGLIPVVCVGETQQQRDDGQTETIVKTQLQAILDKCSVNALAKALIAYEPVWAIGTGLTATPEQAQTVHRFIREFIAGHSGAVAEQVCILYGGSVKDTNAESLFAQPDIDGGLIGGASLNAQAFNAICHAAAP